MTWSQYYRHYISQLQTIYSADESVLIAGWIFEKAGISKSQRLNAPDLIMKQKELETFNHALSELLQHRPVQYVLGETWFYDLHLQVNESVLIPRPETEELVHWIVQDFAKQDNPVQIIDIGTGSGCIAIALKKNLPAANITAMDISNAALATATTNALRNDAMINLIPLNFLAADSWNALHQYDIIVSNPPYIPELEKEMMDDNVLLHEPHLALFVPNPSPLIFYEKIIQFAGEHLATNGNVYVEIHKAHAKETKILFETAFATVELKKDISGNDRMIKATQYRTQ